MCLDNCFPKQIGPWHAVLAERTEAREAGKIVIMKRENFCHTARLLASLLARVRRTPEIIIYSALRRGVSPVPFCRNTDALITGSTPNHRLNAVWGSQLDGYRVER